MEGIIVPEYLRGRYRPLALVQTKELMQELQQRGLLAEVSAEILMPDIELETEEKRQFFRREQFKLMFTQLGQAIGGAPFAFTGVGEQPDACDLLKTREVLIVKVMVLKHPEIPEIKA